MSHVALDFSVTGIDHPCPASYGLVSGRKATYYLHLTIGAYFVQCTRREIGRF